MKKALSLISLFLLTSCSGLQVVDPYKPNNKGMLQMDYLSGIPKLVETYTCTIVAANGKRISATGKSEEEARNEAIAQCQDQTVLSFCQKSKISCEKN